MPERATPSKILGIWERYLLYGRYGTGKTHLALTAPDPIWFLGTGGSDELKTLYSIPFINKVGKREVYYDAVQDIRGKEGMILDNPVGFDNMCRVIDTFIEWNDRENPGIRTIIIDNATVAERLMMDKAIVAEYNTVRGEEKTVLNIEKEWGIRKPHDSTWGGAQSLMDRLIYWLRTLPFHLVVVAHEYRSFEALEGKKRGKKLVAVEPLFVGQQRISIPNLFDNVFHCTVSGGKAFNVQTVGDNIRAAKARVGGILHPDLERDLNLSDVIQKYRDHAIALEEQEKEK